MVIIKPHITPKSPALPPGAPVTVRGFESKHQIKFLWALLPLVLIGLISWAIQDGLLDAGVGFALIVVLAVFIVIILAWETYLTERTFPVALSDEGILVDHPRGKFEVDWQDVLGVIEEFYFSRHFRGLRITLRFRRGEKEESLQLGFKRVVNGIPLELFKVNVMVSAGYDEAIAYLNAKGVKVEISTSKLYEQFAKAKAQGRIKVVRQ